MKCFQSLICPYRSLLLTADSTASGLVESFMQGSYRPEAVMKYLGHLGRFRLSQARDCKSEVGTGTAVHRITSAESTAIPLVQFN